MIIIKHVHEYLTPVVVHLRLIRFAAVVLILYGYIHFWTVTGKVMPTDKVVYKHLFYNSCTMHHVTESFWLSQLLIYNTLIHGGLHIGGVSIITHVGIHPALDLSYRIHTYLRLQNYDNKQNDTR
jgi:hypothetical protein